MLGLDVGEHVHVMPIASMFRRARLTVLGSTLVSLTALSGCIITITDDVAEDEQGDSESDSSSAGTSESSSSESTTDDPSDSSTTDDPSDSSTTDDPSDSTSSGDPTDTTTGGGECDPMAAMNGPEECWSPRGWFWNGEACEQITCTCYGDDCNSLFVDEQACLDQYGQCLPEPPDCAPQDVAPVGGCEPELGWFWNGVECELLSACSCEGSDCDNLYASDGECKLAHESCVGGNECEPDDAQAIGDCALPLGTAWSGDNCISLSGCECAGSDCEAVAMTSEQECWDAHALCELGDPCQADDAFGEGPCDAFFGFKWNGDACEGVSGCECVGLDCEFLDWDLALCEEAHAECGGGGVPPCPGITDAQGVGLCQLFLGWAWNGMQCVGVSGCSCEGADCNNLYPELDICEMETAGCQ